MSALREGAACIISFKSDISLKFLWKEKGAKKWVGKGVVYLISFLTGAKTIILIIIMITTGQTRRHKGTPPLNKNSFGGGGALPEFVGPFFHHITVPFILTSISCYVILFGHF